MLDKEISSKKLKSMSIAQKNELAKELRKRILEVVSNNGGHLASNLGVVELTIALHSVFDLKKDKIVWDVGHQTYVHKILTGRAKEFSTLRQFGGIAGFPKTNESEVDCFNTGHSSTSISAALGIARARDIKNKNNNVIAVIGDGALTGGMALEALNDAGNSKTDITVILNDNEMSISPNTGGLNRFLGKLRTKKLYKKSNISIRNAVLKIPVIGEPFANFCARVKNAIKQFVIPKMYFEDIGFCYLGPVDGHNIQQLENILQSSKEVKGPILIHVLTKKGKGYEIAEKNPDKYHSTPPFNIETGEPNNKKSDDYSKVFGKKLISLAKQNKNVVAITASMKDGTGLSEFSRKFPKRFFDVGIAEQHAICLAAGMAKEGIVPFVPIYSSFYQRGYDQVIHDIATQNLPVIMCVDRAGVVGEDGETHQGMLDLAFFRSVPNLVIMAPKNFEELKDMMEFAVELKKPVVIRYPRGGEDAKLWATTKYKSQQIELGKAEKLQNGKDLSIIAIGKSVEKALKVAKKLEEYKIKAEVINARFLKPLDKTTIIRSIKKTGKIATIEDGTKINGLGTAVKELIIDEKLENIEIKEFAYPDKFIEHGSVDKLEKKYKQDVNSIAKELLL